MLKNNSKLQQSQKLSRTELKKVTGGVLTPQCPESCYFDDSLPGGSSCPESQQCVMVRCPGMGYTQVCQ
ncbi:hypothetical protein HQN84_13340 [Pedobacter steynii]|uniref:hypothetical protein n=1 Tax=Pedobacter steynii TaxID=430522 RepID=UPI00115FCA3A|nr:hypothetical protein [Pedobacter steynii]NQX39835.1 hypothetical protein [Pedobacter steynii]